MNSPFSPTTENSDVPLWRPDPVSSKFTAMYQLMERRGYNEYDSLHSWSVERMDEFWMDVVHLSGLVYEGNTEPVYHADQRVFFPNLRLSYAENLLRWRGDEYALICYSENGDIRRFSRDALRLEVGRFQEGLRRCGVRAGDVVAGLVPNTMETLVAMLAANSLGAIWTACSPDFGVAAALDRLAQTAPRIFVAASGYDYHGKLIPLGAKIDGILQGLPSVERAVIFPFGSKQVDHCEPSDPRVLKWSEFCPADSKQPEFLRLPFNSPLAVLYSSGTTGKPKGIVHGAGGTLIQHAKEHLLHGDVREGDVVFYYTTCGWMMWNWLISTLQIGATAVLYEGSPFHPGPLALWELAARENITHFGTSAKYLKSCRQSGIQPRELGLEALRVIFSTGSPLHAQEFDWVYQSVKKSVLLSSISGGTDIISCFLLGNPVLPVFRGEIQCLGLGMDVGCEEESGLTGIGRAGELICRAAFPSMPLGFWNDPDGHRYRRSYFKNGGNIWYHGDQILITGSQGQKGGIVVLGRSDTTLNPGGVRIGTAEIYRAVEGMASVEDCIAVGVMFDDEEKVALFVRLAPDVGWNEDLKNQIRSKIRHQATPRHLPEVIFPVNAIPHTRNGKKMELVLRDLFRGREPDNLASMANPECLDEYRRLRDTLTAGL